MKNNTLPEKIIIDLSEQMTALLEEVACLAGIVESIDEVMGYLFEFLLDRQDESEVDWLLTNAYGTHLEDRAEALVEVANHVIEQLRTRLLFMRLVELQEKIPYRFERVFATNSIILVREDLRKAPVHQAWKPFYRAADEESRDERLAARLGLSSGSN